MKKAEKNERINELMGEITPENLKTAMREFGDVNDSFFGKNKKGEDVVIGIKPDGVSITTYQANGWVRNNFYNEEGELEGEMYSGRWVE